MFTGKFYGTPSHFCFRPSFSSSLVALFGSHLWSRCQPGTNHHGPRNSSEEAPTSRTYPCTLDCWLSSQSSQPMPRVRLGAEAPVCLAFLVHDPSGSPWKLPRKEVSPWDAHVSGAGQTSHSASGLAGVFLKLLPMDVVDAKGLDSEPVGEDRTCGKGRWRLFNIHIKKRDEHEHKMTTRTLFTLKHLERCRVRMSEMWYAQREKFACVRVRSGVLNFRRVQGSCHCLDAKSRKKTATNQQLRLQLLGVCKKIKTAVRLSGWWWQLPTCRLKLGLTTFLVLGSTSLRTRVDVVSLYHFFRPLAVFPIVVMPVRSPWRRTPPGWTWWPAGRRGWRLRTFFCEIFSPISAQPLKIPLQWRIKLIMYALYLGTMVFVAEVATAYLRWHSESKVDCYVSPFVNAALQASDQLWASWDFL